MYVCVYVYVCMYVCNYVIMYVCILACVEVVTQMNQFSMFLPGNIGDPTEKDLHPSSSVMALENSPFVDWDIQFSR
jgi:hypothetical protein